MDSKRFNSPRKATTSRPKKKKSKKKKGGNKKRATFKKKIVVQYHTTIIDEDGNEIDKKIEEEVIEGAKDVKNFSKKNNLGSKLGKQRRKKKRSAKKKSRKSKSKDYIDTLTGRPEFVVPKRLSRNSSPANT